MPEAMSQDEAIALLSAESSPYALGRARIGGAEYRVFQHAPRNLGVLYALAKRHDARVMLVYEDERYSFAEVRARTGSLAHHLVHDFGIRKGDRVALAMRNFPEWCFTYAAATSIGAVVVPLNAWWTGAELRYGIEDSGSRLLVLDDERYERLLPELASLRAPCLVARSERTLAGNAHAIESLLGGDFETPSVEVEPEDDATIMYTSGSTGHPKGVVSTHRAVISAVFTWEFLLWGRLLPELPEAAVQRVKAWLALGSQALSTGPLELPQSAMLLTLPLFHVTGCNVQFLPAFRSGRKIVMMRKWNPERALELIEREKVTDFSGVPTMSWELVHSPDFEKRDTSTLRSLSAGGAARPPEQVKGLRERGKGALPGTGYGMTETNSLGAAISGDDYLARPASVGKALPPLIELKVIDDQGRTLGPGREGEVCIKGACNMRGYWNRPEETEAVLRDGYIHSGDLGVIDAGGFLFITGRAKDIVIRGGENISCPEVEHVLYEHPAVFEAAVYGVPDERLGEAVAATVMVRAGQELTAEAVRQHVASRLARFKVPAHVFVQREPLARVAAEKIDKRAIKKTAVERLAGRSSR